MSTAIAKRREAVVQSWMGGQPPPATLEEYREAMARAVRDMDGASWRLAALVHRLREAHYPSPEQTQAWMAAVEAAAGVSRVWAYKCVAACDYVLRELQRHPQVATLDVGSAAALSKITPRNQPVFWARHGEDLSTLTRTQIEHVAGKLAKDAEAGDGETHTVATCEVCSESFVPRKDAETTCPDCRRAARKRTAASQMPSLAALRQYDPTALDALDEYSRALVHADRLLEALRAQPQSPLPDAAMLTLMRGFRTALDAVGAEYARWYGPVPQQEAP